MLYRDNACAKTSHDGAIAVRRVAAENPLFNVATGQPCDALTGQNWRRLSRAVPSWAWRRSGRSSSRVPCVLGRVIRWGIASRRITGGRRVEPA